MQLHWAPRLWDPAPWCLGRLFIFARPCAREVSKNVIWISLSTKNALVRTREFPLLSNDSKHASALYLRSIIVVTRLTEHDDVIKPLLREAPHLGLALGPTSVKAGAAYIQCDQPLGMALKCQLFAM